MALTNYKINKGYFLPIYIIKPLFTGVIIIYINDYKIALITAIITIIIAIIVIVIIVIIVITAIITIVIVIIKRI